MSAFSLSDAQIYARSVKELLASGKTAADADVQAALMNIYALLDEAGFSKDSSEEDENELEQHMLISVRVSRNDGESIPGSHHEALSESCFGRAQEMIAEGYHQGELHEDINDEEGEASYSGWWSVSTTA